MDATCEVIRDLYLMGMEEQSVLGTILTTATIDDDDALLTHVAIVIFMMRNHLIVTVDNINICASAGACIVIIMNYTVYHHF